MKADNKRGFIKENFAWLRPGILTPSCALVLEERRETKSCVCDLISLFSSLACYHPEKPPLGGRLILFGEYTVGPRGVRSGSCLCAAASSCLSGRKRGEEETKTCTMFDQRGAESHQDGRTDQGFNKQTEGGETQRDFWEVKPPPASPAFKVSLGEHVQIQSWSTDKCLFSPIPNAAKGLFWREICEPDETPPKTTLSCIHLRCGEYESATANCNYPTRVGKCSHLKASPLHLQQCWASSDHTMEEGAPLLCHMWLWAPLEKHFINNFTSPLHGSGRKY